MVQLGDGLVGARPPFESLDRLLAVRETYGAEALWNLGLLYAPTMFVVYMLAILAIFAYRISQDIHEQTLQTLAESGE